MEDKVKIAKTATGRMIGIDGLTDVKLMAHDSTLTNLTVHVSSDIIQDLLILSDETIIKIDMLRKPTKKADTNKDKKFTTLPTNNKPPDHGSPLISEHKKLM